MSSYAQRLSQALREKGISQSELARMIGVKPQIIQYLCRSKVRSSRFTFEIAQALEISPEWLQAGQDDDANSFSLIGQAAGSKKMIPLLDWVGLYAYALPGQAQALPPSNESILVDRDYAHAICLTMPDNSMLPKFEPRTQLIVSLDVNQADLNQKYVIAYLKEDDVFLFRQLVIDNKKRLLVPLNTRSFKEVVLTNNDIIVARLVECRTFYPY